MVAIVVDRKRAVLLCQISEIAYSEPVIAIPQLAMLGYPGADYFSVGSTQGYVCKSGDTHLSSGDATGTATAQDVIVVYRGTEMRRLADLLVDSEIALTNGPYGSRVHTGFARAFDASWEAVRALLDARMTADCTLTVTGHSLGAALARLASERVYRLCKWGVSVYTYGEPRSGDRVWAEICDDVPGESRRIVNGADLVSRVVPRINGYAHAKGAVQVHEDGRLDDSVSWWEGWIAVHDRRIKELMRGRLADLAEHAIAEYRRGLEIGG